MNSSVYAAYSGMRAQMEALDIMSNNLANVNTAGFKQEKAFFTALEDAMNGAPAGEARQSSMVQASSTMERSDGSLVRTNRDLDVALSGNGFLVVNSPQGVRYTRNGQLSVNGQSQLCSGGFPLVGETGRPVPVGPGEIVINEQGDVYVNNARVDRLKIVTFDSPSALTKEGSSLFVQAQKDAAAKPGDARVQQGYLEQSNVNAVSCVVGLVGIMRQYEAVQKTVNVMMNDVNAKAIERLSR